MSDGRPGQQGDVDVPAIQQLLLGELDAEVEVTPLEIGILEVVARLAERRVGVTAAGEVQPLVVQVLLVELRQVGEELIGALEAVMDVAVHDADAGFLLGGPAGSRDGCRAGHGHRDTSTCGGYCLVATVSLSSAFCRLRSTDRSPLTRVIRFRSSMRAEQPATVATVAGCAVRFVRTARHACLDPLRQSRFPIGHRRTHSAYQRNSSAESMVPRDAAR